MQRPGGASAPPGPSFTRACAIRFASIFRAPSPHPRSDSVSAVAVAAVPVPASMVIGPAVIEMTRAVVVNVVDARRILEPRTRIVDRRSLVVGRGGVIVDGCRLVHG